MRELLISDHKQNLINSLYMISRSWLFLAIIIVLNLSGGIVGLMYYIKDLDNYHPLLWIIIPDSPLTALAIMLFFITCKKRSVISIFLMVRSVRDAIFNVIFLIILDPTTFLPGYYELGVVTGIATHAIMIIECIFLIPYLPEKVDLRKWSIWSFILILEEIIDISIGTIPHLDVVRPFLLEFAFFLLLTIMVTLLVLTLYVSKNSPANDSLPLIMSENI